MPTPVPVKAPACDPGPMPIPPELHSAICTTPEGTKICLVPQEAVLIWEWARDVQRWGERIQVCTDALRAEPTKKAPPSSPITLLPKDIEELAAFLKDPEVDFTVEVKRCGEVNSYYWPDTHRITVCTETIAVSHALARAFLAHEVGHAYIIQLDIPFTGSHEAAADEFAYLALMASGHTEDIPAIADYYWKMAQDPDMDPAGWDDHPTNMQRYHVARCLYSDAHDGTAILCRHDLRRIQRTWARLLNPSK